jgi:hypothetical protein
MSSDQSASLRAAITCHLNSIAYYGRELAQPHTRIEQRWMRKNQKAHYARIIACQRELQDDV